MEPAAFNSFGARRGHHEVMMRGTFGNIRLKNALAEQEGPYTTFQPGGEPMFIYDAAMRYADEGTPLMILAGLAIVGGWVGIPHFMGGGAHFSEFLAPVFAGGHGVEHVAEATHGAHGAVEVAGHGADAHHDTTMEWILAGAHLVGAVLIWKLATIESTNGFLIFSLLYLTYGQAGDAIRIFTCVPFSAVGGIAALWARDIPFSISAGVGFIALAGVAVERDGHDPVGLSEGLGDLGNDLGRDLLAREVRRHREQILEVE